MWTLRLVAPALLRVTFASSTLPYVLCIAVLTSSCTTHAPPPSEELRKEALVDISLDRPWKAAQAAGMPTAEPLQDDWLKSFQDPTLDALVLEAMTKNADLRVAAARLEQAAEYIVVAQSALRPSISLFGTGGSNTGSGGDATSALQATVLSASWELDVWGRLRYARNATREAYASASADYEFARQSLAASIAKAWFTATRLSMNVDAALDTLEAARQLQSLAEDRQRVGAGTEADTAVARASSREAEGMLREIEFSRGQALRALELLLGRYPAAELAARAELPTLTAPVPVGVPLQMLERRPDVIAAERRVAAAFNRVGEAQAARLPQLSLSLSVGAYESDILELKEDFENPVGGLGGRLLAPIYQGGALQAQVRIRTAEQKEATADYARVALRALSDVEDAIAASESLDTRVTLATEALQDQVRALEFTRTRLRVGRADRRALEQQRLVVNDTRVALTSLEAERLAARVNLHLALGGSFEQRQEQAQAQR